MHCVGVNAVVVLVVVVGVKGGSPAVEAAEGVSTRTVRREEDGAAVSAARTANLARQLFERGQDKALRKIRRW